MQAIKVVIFGAGGRVSQVMVDSLCRQPGIVLVGATEQEVSGERLPLPDGSGEIPFASDLSHILETCQPDVLVDFTIAAATMAAVPIATGHGVNMVIGTTGLSADDLEEIKRLAEAHQVGVVVAPNFALGAVLMMHMVKIAAKYFDYAEIIELHHEKKVDAPSGTAIATARAMAAARGSPFVEPGSGERALSRAETLEGVTIHSVRLPGLMAHQEVLLGGPGQTLCVRHDTIGRECYVPGVVLAIKEVVKRKGLIHGLDALLGL